MNFLSVCSGIEAASVAWAPLGFHALAFSEIDKFPSAVLAHHYPSVPNLGDMTKFKEWPDYDPDILVGGTPCQSFSVAGLRKGLADPRGNLMLTYLAIADRYKPQWIVWENVPGVLSSGGGRDFGTFLGALGQVGYGWAYRVMDAQFFGIPQRRRRVFVVGYLGDWRRAAAVLFERHNLSGNPPPSRETRESTTYPVAPCLGASDRGFGRVGDTRGNDAVVAYCPDIAHTTTTITHQAKGGDPTTDNYIAQCVTGSVTHALKADGFDASEDGTGRGQPIIAIQERAISENPDAGPDGVGVRTDGLAYTLEARTIPQAVMTLAIRGRDGHPTLEVRDDRTANAILTPNGGRGGIGVGTIVAPLTASYGKQIDSSDTSSGPPNLIQVGMRVRRLTPRECERLQGFPDDYTFIPFTHGKPAADGPRYKALGNSMAVPVMRWIGKRIQLVDWLHANN